MSKNRIKQHPSITQGKRFAIKEEELVSMPGYDYPIFCFKHIHKDFSLENCNTEEKKSLIEKVASLSQMTWQNIMEAPRHGLGTEKIKITSLKFKCPSFITEDVTYLLALRFQGKKPILGHRDRFIFHIIVIDTKFNAYNH